MKKKSIVDINNDDNIVGSDMNLWKVNLSYKRAEPKKKERAEFCLECGVEKSANIV